jgi:hypothetical protein
MPVCTTRQPVFGKHDIHYPGVYEIMKKHEWFLILLVGFVFVVGLSSPVSATLLVDIDTGDLLTNQNPTYWTGADENSSTFRQLANSNPTTEEAWLEAILGLPYDDPTVNYFDDIDYGDAPLSGISPGFVWEYAVVKYGAYWAAFEGDFLDESDNPYAGITNVSHITYFNGATSVPEPSTILLLGAGMVGLAGIRRKKIKS